MSWDSPAAAHRTTILLLPCLGLSVLLLRDLATGTVTNDTFAWRNRRDGALQLAMVWQHARLTRLHHCMDFCRASTDAYARAIDNTTSSQVQGPNRGALCDDRKPRALSGNWALPTVRQAIHRQLEPSSLRERRDSAATATWYVVSLAAEGGSAAQQGEAWGETLC